LNVFDLCEAGAEGSIMIAGWDRFRTVRALCPHGLVDAIATPIAPSREKATSRASQRQFFIRLGLFLIALVLALLALLESRTSWGEAHIFAYIARHMTFHLVRTAGNPVVPTVTGPYDMRLGYAQLPSTLAHLKRFGFRVVAHAESSGLAQEAVKYHLPAIFPEKTQAGLLIDDDRSKPLYQVVTPERVYRNFDSIPELTVRSLLFVENRVILDVSTPDRNPAVEWDRLGRAILDLGLNRVDHSHPVTGGSTVATQLEKLRHSPGGRTASAGDKLRQMLSASLRAYQSGPQSLGARRQVVCDYINSLPLAATSNQGEVIGLSDGLHVWFGEDAGKVGSLINLSDEAALTSGRMRQKALAYREVLTLLLAAKKPSELLGRGRDTLARRVDAYVGLLARNGTISETLRKAALETKLRFYSPPPAHSVPAFVGHKGVDAIRIGLLPLLGVRNLYDLDRLDLKVQTTLDQQASAAVTRILKSFRDPQFEASAGLLGEHLLDRENRHGLVYSFTLYERGSKGNFLRVQADNYGEPLSINEGTKLELGSTAKLRTLACYLELISELHSRLSVKSQQQLRSLPIDPEDSLSAWAVGYLSTASDMSLPAMLEAAMNRTYSANPDEGFFTGGGLHHFVNYEASDNGRVLTVREAFERSVNLVFIRLLRDVVHYRMFQNPESRAVLDSDASDPVRRQYLSRFADTEGQAFLEAFYRKYRSHPAPAFNVLLDTHPLTPVRFSAMVRYVEPELGLSKFESLGTSYSVPIRQDEMESLYSRFGPGKFNLNDQAYSAKVHPLELWLAAYLSHHPHASFSTVLAASSPVRQEAYAWLFKSTRKHAQDIRIRTLLERDAFAHIHTSWARVGFPFDKLVPSFATAIGSSGDNPEALATLAGIILNGGIRNPSIRIQELRLAEGTPMETILKPESKNGERVMLESIASVLRRELVGVVEHGTAQRALRSVTLADGRVIPVGGKTGTGDNRIEHFDAHGAVLEAKVRNRTGAFVFTIGDRFFGTVLAFSSGRDAAAQSFTSALAVQVFRDIMPALRPLFLRSFHNSTEELRKNISANP